MSSTLILLIANCLLLGANGQYYGSPPLQSSMALQTAMPTVTVRGFLNFRTTVDGTVIVFTPSPSQSSKTAQAALAPPIAHTRAPVPPTPPPTPPPPPPPPQPRFREPEIQPTQVQGPVQHYPTGLVTVLGGTVVQEGATTVYETKVIGTYISGKYAQILSSTTRVKPRNEMVSPTVRPTMPVYRHPVQATRVPRPEVNNRAPARVEETKEDEPTVNAIARIKKVHPLRSKTQKLMESAKARHLNARNERLHLNPLKSRWTKAIKPEEQDTTAAAAAAEGQSETNEENKSVVKIRKARLGTRRFALQPRQSPRTKMVRFRGKLPPTQAEEMQQYYNSKAKEETTTTTTTTESVVIDERTKEQILENLDNAQPEVEHHHESESQHEPNSMEIDPSKVVKEIQTITSEVTHHVEGNPLQVKTHTMTTTIERALHPSESEFDTQLVKPTIDISVNDLEATSIPETPALVISRTYSVTERTMRTTVVPVFDGTATQSHTVTESFFIRKLITAYRTLPPGDMILIDSTSTSSTGLNTVLINGSEIADLSMAEQEVLPSSVESVIEATQMPSLASETPNSENAIVNTIQPLMPSIEPSAPFVMPQMFPMQPNQFAQKFDLNNPLLLAAVLQNPQLAAVYFGLQQMKQQQQGSQQYNTVTKPTQVMQTETVYNTKVVSFYDGRQTRSRTILESAGTTEKLLNTFTTELVPIMNPVAALQQAQLGNALATQLGMMPQYQITPTLATSTILKTVTTVTDHTITKSKVYTLVYNAFSTRYRTITSTSVMPTTVTTVLTETMMPSNSVTLPSFFG